MKSTSRRLQNINTQYFASLGNKIAAMQAKGINIIRLDVGSPDLPPAPHIIEALARSAADHASHGYQPHLATKRFRESWAGLYKNLIGIDLDIHREIVPLLGSKEGIFHMIQAFIDPGDVVLIPDPGYLTYDMATRVAGGEAYHMPLVEVNNYLPDLEAIPEHIAKRAKLLWLNYPNNPTAAVAPLDFFQQALDYAQAYDLLVLHDSAYAQVTFDGYISPSMLELPGALERTVEFNSVSKSYNMAGWRVGAALGNRDALSVLFTLKTQIDSGHFLPILEAASSALSGDQSWIIDRNLVYQARRDLVINHLQQIGLHARIPKASLYIWCKVPVPWRAQEFCEAILEQAHVSLTPGEVFGRYGSGYMRISLTAPDDKIEEAMIRLERWMT